MVSGKVDIENHFYIAGADVMQSSQAFETTMFGAKAIISKAIGYYPDDKFRVYVFMTFNSPAMRVIEKEGWNRISRPFDTLEQAQEVYNYITSMVKYNDIGTFANWKHVMAAYTNKEGVAMKQMLIEI